MSGTKTTVMLSANSCCPDGRAWREGHVSQPLCPARILTRGIA
jgi:hypothetical protein